MYHGQRVIDVHGHFSAPPELNQFSMSLINLRQPDTWVWRSGDGSGRLIMSDESFEAPIRRHLQAMDERGIDIQLVSNHPVHMWHWETLDVQQIWCRTVNDAIAQKVRLRPDRFVGVGQLPQNAQVETSNCVAELEYCIKELGFVGIMVNPDPGADHTAPGMQYEYWYPLYRKAEELGATLMIHASIWRNPALKGIPHHYQINNAISEFLAGIALEHSDVFRTFPKLKIFVSHCGGALNRFAAEDTVHTYGRMPLPDNLMYDTCAYDIDFLSTGIKQHGAHRTLFGTEAPGAGGITVRANGRKSDDLIPVIDSFDFLSEDDKLDIFGRNALRFFPLLNV